MMENSDFLKHTGYYLAVCVKNIRGMKESNTLLAVIDWTDDDLHKVNRAKNAFARSMVNKEIAVKSDGLLVYFKTIEESPYEVRLVAASDLHEGPMKDFVDNVARGVPLGVGGCLGTAYVDPGNWPGLVKYVEEGAIAVHDEFADKDDNYYMYLTQLWYR